MGLLSKKPRTKGVSDPAKLLITEHEKVERLFDQLESAGGAVERQGLIAQLDAELSAHTAKEETILYPFIARHVPNGVGMVHEANHEHGLAKQALADLVSMDPGDPGLMPVAQRLQKLVASHVKEEEKAIFPALEKSASGDDLGRLRGELEAAKFAGVEHPLEVAPVKKATAKKATAKKATAKKATAKKATAKKATAKKATAKKATAKKATAKKATAKKATAKKATAKKATAKKAAGRSTSRAAATLASSSGSRPAKKAAAKKLASTRGAAKKAPAKKKAAAKKAAARRR